MRPFERILVPVDFTEDADAEVHSGFGVETEGGTVAIAPATARVLELAARLAGEDGELRLVHVTPTYESARIYGGASMGVLGSKDIEAIHSAAKDASLQVLETVAQRFAANARCTFLVKPGAALPVILEEAAGFDAQLVVIAASGRSRVARFFLGSTADRIIRESPCPVMVLPCHDAH